LIKLLKNGDISAVLTGALMLIFAKVLWYIQPSFLEAAIPETIRFNNLARSVDLPFKWVQICCLVCILIQGLWLNEIMRGEGLFDRQNRFIFLFFVISSLLSMAQTVALGAILFQFCILYLLSKIMSLNEENLGEPGIFLDVGTVFALGLVIFPRGVFFLPFFLIVLNAFSLFDFNRLLLFLLGIFMVLFVLLSIRFLSLNENPLDLIRTEFSFIGTSFRKVAAESSWTGVLVLVINLIIFGPMLWNSLGRIPVKQRKFLRMLWLVVTGVLLIVLLPSGIADGITFVALPMAVTLGFIYYNVPSNLWTNFALICTLWALFVIQWSYF
jgi:hypothetical protein